MQIHELTEASLADRIKQAVTSPVQTAQQISQNVAQRSAAANLAQARSQQEKIQQQAAQSAAILKQRGYQTGSTQSAQPAVAPGQRITVTANVGGTPARYFKTSTGWQNELGQSVTNANSIAYLEKLLPATATGRTSAGPVGSTGASAVMTSADLDRALTQMQISPRQIEALKNTAQQNPSFTQALLKKLGLTK